MYSVVLFTSLMMTGSTTAMSIASPSSVLRFVFPDVSSERSPTTNFLPPPPPPPGKSHEPLPPPLTAADDRNDIVVDHRRPTDYYDVLYNDVITCPLKGYVAEGRALVDDGTPFRVLAVHDRHECMTVCFHDSQCRSVNVVPHDELGKFVCELNERQRQPTGRGLARRPGSVYYDRIECDEPKTTSTTETTPTSKPVVRTTTTSLWSKYLSKSNIIEKFNNIRDYEVDSAYKASKDLAVKLSRLAMLEKVLKLFGGPPKSDEDH